MLSFGKTRADKVFAFPLDVRLKNIAFYGGKGSGKSEKMLPMLANDQLEKEAEGAVFVVGNSQISWLIYALAKKYHRDVLFLSPSVHNGMKELMNIGVSNLQDITDHLVDFSDVMMHNKIVIVDAEPYRYQKKAVDLVGSILMNLQTHLYRNSVETPFFVYIDDGDAYLPYSKDLLLYGSQFGIGSILFFQSRALTHAKSPLLTYFVEANVRTTVLTNALIYDDFKYFKDRFYGDGEDDNFLLQRQDNQLLIETIVNDVRGVTYTELRYLPAQLIREIEEEAEKQRKNEANQPDYSYSVAQTEDASEQDKEPPKRKQRKVAPKPLVAKLSNPTTRIFISESDLFD